MSLLLIRLPAMVDGSRDCGGFARLLPRYGVVLLIYGILFHVPFTSDHEPCASSRRRVKNYNGTEHGCLMLVDPFMNLQPS